MELIMQNMTPPTSCSTCFLNRGEKRPEYGLSIFCPYSHGVIKDEKYIYGGKLESCGILPFADHGRLIDADALLADDNRKYDTYRGANGRDTLLDDVRHRAIQWAIKNAPTVIPATNANTESK